MLKSLIVYYYMIDNDRPLILDMKNSVVLLFLFGILTFGCAEKTSNSGAADIDAKAAETFIDAFYSFDQDSLKSLLDNTDDSANSILFYQGWAEGGNYEVMRRSNCYASADSVITCPVTVKDDLIQALQLDLFVTDTFHLTIANGDILSIETSSNDPPLFYEARQWVRDNRPELTEIPCSEDSNSPGDCVRAVVMGFKEFMASR